MTKLSFEEQVVAARGELMIIARSRFWYPGSDIDTEDLVQSTILRSLESKHLYKPLPGRPLMAWLRTIMRNLYIQAYRRNQVVQMITNEDYFTAQQEALYRQEDVIELQQLFACLRSSVSPETRRIILLKAHGYLNAEIAAMYGVPEGTIKSRYHRGLKRLSVAFQ